MSMWDNETEIEHQDVNEVSFWDAKQQQSILPAASGVLLKIKKTKVCNKDKEGNEKPNKSINVQFELVDGITMPDGSIKYKRMSVGQFFTYFSSKQSDWVKKGQHTIPLRTLITACGLTKDGIALQLIPGGIADESAQLIADTLVGLEVIGNITVKNKQAFNPDTQKWEAISEQENEVKGFKSIQQ